MLSLTSKVTVLEFTDIQEKLKQALETLGIDDINTPERPVVIKPGIFNQAEKNHPTVDTLNAIISCFNKTKRIFIAESDNYKGTGIERLQIYKELFAENVVPFNLSEDANAKIMTIANEEMRLSDILFKPNVMVDTHILSSFDKGSILKNLFGCIPTSKKMKYHKVLPELLADVFEAIGGVDLAVLDGTYFFSGVGGAPVQTNIIIAGRDAVAVESVGATLSGLNPEEMPVIGEFVDRGLGEGKLENIEIIGASLWDIKRKIESASRKQKKMLRRRKGPQTWGGLMYRELQTLIKEGYFDIPDKRNLVQVIDALQSKGLSTEGKKDNISKALDRRVKSGVLKKTRIREEWVYWTE